MYEKHQMGVTGNFTWKSTCDEVDSPHTIPKSPYIY